MHKDQSTRTRLEGNIFPAAHQACEPWEKFLWHPRAHVADSSQALAIDVFGTIKTSPDRDKIFDALAQSMGLPIGGPWDITLEWTARPSLLNEPDPTQVDVYAENPQSIIFFEGNFTDQGGGACSETKKQQGVILCDGNYGEDRTQVSNVMSRCALSDKGIQYWNIIPKVFYLESEADYQPCPFAGSSYQWMRNLVAAYKVGRQKNKQPAVVMVYANHPAQPKVEKGRFQAWTEFSETVIQDHISLHVRSYQEILKLSEQVTHQGCGEATLWQELQEWVERKMTAITSARGKPKRKPSSRSHAKALSRNG